MPSTKSTVTFIDTVRHIKILIECSNATQVIAKSVDLADHLGVLGEGTTSYLPSTVGGHLFLDSNDQPLGDGSTRYLPTTVKGVLYLSMNNQPLGNGGQLLTYNS